MNTEKNDRPLRGLRARRADALIAVVPRPAGESDAVAAAEGLAARGSCACEGHPRRYHPPIFFLGADFGPAMTCARSILATWGRLWLE